MLDGIERNFFRIVEICMRISTTQSMAMWFQPTNEYSKFTFSVNACSWEMRKVSGNGNSCRICSAWWITETSHYEDFAFFEIENSVFKKTNTSDSDAKSTKPSYDFGKDYAILMNAFMKRYFIELEVKPNRKSARTMTRDTLFTYSECNSEVTTNPVHPVRSKTNSEMLKLLLVTTFGRWARR